MLEWILGFVIQGVTRGAEFNIAPKASVALATEKWGREISAPLFIYTRTILALCSLRGSRHCLLWIQGKVRSCFKRPRMLRHRHAGDYLLLIKIWIGAVVERANRGGVFVLPGGSISKVVAEECGASANTKGVRRI
jgi:hypothetical protein